MSQTFNESFTSHIVDAIVDDSSTERLKYSPVGFRKIFIADKFQGKKHGKIMKTIID